MKGYVTTVSYDENGLGTITSISELKLVLPETVNGEAVNPQTPTKYVYNSNTNQWTVNQNWIDPALYPYAKEGRLITIVVPEAITQPGQPFYEYKVTMLARQVPFKYDVANKKFYVYIKFYESEADRQACLSASGLGVQVFEHTLATLYETA